MGVSLMRVLGRETFEIELLAEHFAQQLVPIQPLTLAPETSQPLPGLAAREPPLAESLLEGAPPMHLERPGPQVARGVEPVVHIGKPSRPWPRNAYRVG